MDIPGLADALSSPEMRERGEEEAERLLETLKKEVKAQVEDIGTLRKRLHVTVPATVISDHLAHNFKELRGDAVVPGFRKGHAPLKLVEKRFGHEVRDSLKTSIVGQSFLAAAENEELEVLGDPLFEMTKDKEVRLVDFEDALRDLDLPDAGDFQYTCEVEIKPTFELPELKGIEIKAPQISISAENVADHILRQRKIRGRYEPLLQDAAETDDMAICDVTLVVDGATVKQEENVQLGVRPARVDGIALPTLGDVLKGAKAADKRRVDCEIPQDYERPDLRGKAGTFEFQVHELKRLVPASMETYIEQIGAESEKELREFVRDDLEGQLGDLVRRDKKQQVMDYLLNNTKLELPSDLSTRQIERAVARRVIEQRQSGVPQSEIDAHIDELRTSAAETVNRDLRLEFILDKVAETLEVNVADEEVNTEIARIARLYNRRFDRVRDDLEQQGLLRQLAEQIRQDKCVQHVLGDAKIIELQPEAEEPKKPPAEKKKTAAKKKAAGPPAKKSPAAKKKVAAKKAAPKKKAAPRAKKKSK